MSHTEDRFERRQRRLRTASKWAAIIAILGLAGSFLVNYATTYYVG
jgi:hypothetical protein